MKLLSDQCYAIDMKHRSPQKPAEKKDKQIWKEGPTEDYRPCVWSTQMENRV